jgi:hypothetical protein
LVPEAFDFMELASSVITRTHAESFSRMGTNLERYLFMSNQM